MLDFSVAVLPLIVLSAVNFVLSWLWYSPVLFAKPWMKALGMEADHQMTEEEKKQMPLLFLGGIIASFLLVYVMMVIVNSVGATSFPAGMAVGLVLWVGFAVTHSLNTLWEGRKPVVLVINNGLYLLTYVIYGGVLAIWQ